MHFGHGKMYCMTNNIRIRFIFTGGTSFCIQLSGRSPNFTPFSLPKVDLIMKPFIMDNYLQFQLIVLLLLVTVCAAEAKKRVISYNVMGKRQIIFGKLGAEFNATSNQECSSGRKSSIKICDCPL